jgi:hypothetical protein
MPAGIQKHVTIEYMVKCNMTDISVNGAIVRKHMVRMGKRLFNIIEVCLAKTYSDNAFNGSNKLVPLHAYFEMHGQKT